MSEPTKLPCEVVIKEIVPSVKSEIVYILYNKYNFTQTEIAEKIGVTQASVSQYIQKTRGKKREIIDRFPRIKKRSQEIAKKIAEGGDYQESLCSLCKKIRKEGILQD